MRRFFRSVPQEDVRNQVADLDAFLRKLEDRAHSSKEQVAWADFKGDRSVVVGVSVRKNGVFLIVDGEGKRPLEFQSDEPGRGPSIHHGAALALHQILVSTGVPADADVTVSLTS